MTAADIVTILGGVGAPLLLIGGGVKWVVSRVDKLDDRLKLAEDKYKRLDRDHGRLMVQVDRWRIAFKMVSAELRKHDPGSPALQLASEMLSETPPIYSSDDEEAEEKLLGRLEQGSK